MTALDYILNALGDHLEAERECGVRTLEFDRKFLAALVTKADAGATDGGARSSALAATPPAAVVNGAGGVQTPLSGSSPSVPTCDFVFLHDAALTAAGTEMMAKIAVAMGSDLQKSPIVWEGEKPAAKVYVALGSAALEKWFPGLRGNQGQWLRSAKEETILLVQSPNAFLRFGATMTPAVRQMKVAMWQSLKGVKSRI